MRPGRKNSFLINIIIISGVAKEGGEEELKFKNKVFSLYHKYSFLESKVGLKPMLRRTEISFNLASVRGSAM